MLKRKLYYRLMEWKSREHKSLIVSGQRQTGKTFTITQFAQENYQSLVYLDFHSNPEYSKIFEKDRRAEDIIERMRVALDDARFIPGETLIFLDEIQECSGALISLKYFTQCGRYDVIASGSLLGIHLAGKGDDYAYPLGYVERMTMYGLDFQEYLWARGIPQSAIESVCRDMRAREEIDSLYYERFRELFTEFMVVGGMPESVQKFVDTGSFRDIEPVLRNLESGILSDIAGYSEKNEGPKTIECFRSIPAQLSQTNKRFKYSRMWAEGRKSSDRYMENLLWIRDAGYGNFCYCLLDLVKPLTGKEIRDNFKVYLSDTGMLLHMYGTDCLKATLEGDSSYNMGAVTENAVAECLMKSGFQPRYYRVNKGDSRMEIDFVIMLDKVTAIEVKSGKDRESPSLSKVGRFFDVRRIMLEDGNVRVDDDGIEHMPLFAAAFMDSVNPVEKDPKYETDWSMLWKDGGTRYCPKGERPGNMRRRFHIP